ncbi:MAG: selenium-dependent xanthine dehydrogenase, partial [Ruminococcus sp.]|nr:selenium-dependent xanthine dehydrogenase [Ruminococcus sp.]
MAVFSVNGRTVTVAKNQKLIRYLRDELKLTSVKDGCSEGACGTCHVLIDGKLTKACIPQTDKLDGKSVLTVEGLSDFEKEAYTYAFGKAGAVQCGFCIPGMIMAAKSLIDVNSDPSREDAAFAIRNNICRCTGYVKIIDGILLAAKVIREGRIPADDQDYAVGSRVRRIDVAEKVQGYGKYPDDIYVDGMCYGSAVRSEYPRARVLSIDTSEAEALPGVVCVLTAKDIPGKNYVGHIKKDQPTLIPIGEITHYLGDSVALVCAKDRETLEKAKKLVKVDYEVLEAVHNPEEAASENAPLVFETDENNVQAYKHVSRGDADGAIKNAKYVLSHHFETPWTEHAFLEPECCVAIPLDNGGVKLMTTDQSAHTTLHECAQMLGVDYDHCLVENQLVGGGFGGKEDMSVQHHAALIAYVARVPVKVKLSRSESILVHPKRHPFKMDFTMGCDENGIIQGVKASVTSDTGAFASLGGPVLERACTHAAGPYAYENFEIEGRAYYTNNPPAGAFRGFGVTQTCFATESLLNEMAELVGISPWEIRYRNAIRPGGVLPNGQIVGAETGLVETLEAVKPYYDEAVRNGEPVGLACAMKNAGVGVGLPDWGRAKLIVEDDAKVHIYSGASCIGQGLGTVLTQMVVTNARLSPDDIVYERSNTWIAPDSGDTSGSRQTLITGEACRRACEKLTEALQGNTLSDLIGREFYGEYLAKTDPLGADVPNPVSHVAYGYATQMCILDKDTGKIKRFIAAHDVGKAVNPLSCEGQIEGGVVMSMGYALTERYPIDDNCKPTAKYGTLGLFKANQIPPEI